MLTTIPADETMPAGHAAYTVKEVAAVLGMSPAQVRGYVRAGLVEPGRGSRGELLFGFQDVVLLRSAQGLSHQLSPRRVRRTLGRLKQRLPEGRALTGLRITAEGDDILVREGGASWQAESGQVMLDFDVEDLAAAVAPIALAQACAAEVEPDQSADHWYELGVELEPVALDDARRAYERALRLEPDHARACINLGRLLHHAGDTTSAARLYMRALDQHSIDAIAFFNLGVALEDLDKPGVAVKAYERAVEADPAHADAHYNASRIYERLGDRAAALRHLRTYKTLARD